MRKMLLALVFFLLVMPVKAQTPTRIVPEAPKLVQEGTLSVDELIHASAIKYGANERIMRKTLECESENLTYNGQSKIKNKNGPNGREDSWGYAQIHLPAHKNITKKQALDPAFAINWTAKEFAAGRASQWTCYRNLQR